VQLTDGRGIVGREGNSFKASDCGWFPPVFIPGENEPVLKPKGVIQLLRKLVNKNPPEVTEEKEGRFFKWTITARGRELLRNANYPMDGHVAEVAENNKRPRVEAAVVTAVKRVKVKKGSDG
jgi:hypothetical protein